MTFDQPANMKLVSSDTVFEGMIWDIVREKFEYAGEELTREFVNHPGAVAILAVNERSEVLLIRQYRHPVREYLWEIPAGLRDVEAESAVEAARRELFEETGYRAKKFEPLISFHTTPGGNNETIEIFLATDLTFEGHAIELDGEERDMQVSWVALNECLSSILQSKMRSPSGLVAIMAYALKAKNG